MQKNKKHNFKLNCSVFRLLKTKFPVMSQKMSQIYLLLLTFKYMSPQNTCCHYFSLGLHTKNKPESHLKSGHCMFALNFRFGLLKPFKCSTNVPEKQLSLPTNICFSILASCRSSFFCCSLCSLNVSYLWPDRKEIKQRCHAAGSFP